MTAVPEERIRQANDRAINPDGNFVLYWMIAFRRTEWNFSLQRAVDLARELKKPLVVFEALRADYQWASDRIHHFVIQGMADNAKRLQRKPVTYFPYLEPKPGKGKGLLAELAKRSCVVVSDDFPCFFLPRMIASASSQIPVRFELVDSNGLLPMRAADKVFARAFDFRRFLQKNLRTHLDEFPEDDPLAGSRLPKLDSLPVAITRKWTATKVGEVADDSSKLHQFPIDHSVVPTETLGGARAAQGRLRNFIESQLPRYDESRNQPEQEITSGLSPYLHFGHISAHQVFAATMALDGWSPSKIAGKANGSSKGWWGASSHVESFLDELITWREVGYNMCSRRDDYDQYESLPNWAQKTLAEHAKDKREHVYSLEQFELSETHDDLWNAAQRQLVREGKIHNYLRMLWGKKILEWSTSPRDALDIMIELNNKYAGDSGRPKHKFKM